MDIIKKGFVILLAVLSVLVIILTTGCVTCINVPSSDSVKPLAAVSIYYTDASGKGADMYVNTADHNYPITVNVPRGQPFNIIYSGNDSGGIKMMHLDYKYYRDLAGEWGSLFR